MLAQVGWLFEQDFPPEDFEWVVVDDKQRERPSLLDLGMPFRIVHIPPRYDSIHYAPDVAVNTGLIHAQGELIHFMSDWVHIPPQNLTRHWELYKTYGPNVLIGGNVEGENPRGMNGLIDRDVGEIFEQDTIMHCGWLGRNDSAPLEKAIEVNGLDESFKARAGTDVIFAMRMVKVGCKYVVDNREMAKRAFDHGSRKSERLGDPPWQDTFKRAAAGEVWAPNPINLRTERDVLQASRL